MPQPQGKPFIFRLIASAVNVCFIVSFIAPHAALAQSPADLGLPKPGTMVNLTSAYVPVLIKGLRVHPENPILFDFIVDTGNSKLAIQSPQLRLESEKLIKYFLASLTIPDDDQWVNLSPYEKDRIVPNELGQTEMGRDLLAQDYILKQLTASLIYPEKELGKEFWNKVYTKAQQLHGNTEIPVNTFNKVWIVADKAKVYVHDNTAFVVASHLKVMLEEDYLALDKNTGVIASEAKQSNKIASSPSAPRNDTHRIGSQIIREIVLPELEKEVNQGKNFANLRQIFHSMILSAWYKKNLKEALLNQVYANKAKVSGINVEDATIKEQIYQEYLKAYKKGVFNYIKEDINKATQQATPRKYFSGGFTRQFALVETRQAADLPPGGILDGDGAMITTQTVNSASAAMTTNAPGPVKQWPKEIPENLISIQESETHLTGRDSDSWHLALYRINGTYIVSLAYQFDGQKDTDKPFYFDVGADEGFAKHRMSAIEELLKQELAGKVFFTFKFQSIFQKLINAANSSDAGLIQQRTQAAEQETVRQAREKAERFVVFMREKGYEWFLEGDLGRSVLKVKLNGAQMSLSQLGSAYGVLQQTTKDEDAKGKFRIITFEPGVMAQVEDLYMNSAMTSLSPGGEKFLSLGESKLFTVGNNKFTVTVSASEPISADVDVNGRNIHSAPYLGRFISVTVSGGQIRVENRSDDEMSVTNPAMTAELDPVKDILLARSVSVFPFDQEWWDAVASSVQMPTPSDTNAIKGYTFIGENNKTFHVFVAAGETRQVLAVYQEIGGETTPFAFDATDILRKMENNPYYQAVKDQAMTTAAFRKALDSNPLLVRGFKASLRQLIKFLKAVKTPEDIKRFLLKVDERKQYIVLADQTLGQTKGVDIINYVPNVTALYKSYGLEVDLETGSLVLGTTRNDSPVERQNAFFTAMTELLKALTQELDNMDRDFNGQGVKSILNSAMIADPTKLTLSSTLAPSPAEQGGIVRVFIFEDGWQLNVNEKEGDFVVVTLMDKARSYTANIPKSSLGESRDGDSYWQKAIQNINVILGMKALIVNDFLRTLDIKAKYSLAIESIEEGVQVTLTQEDQIGAVSLPTKVREGFPALLRQISTSLVYFVPDNSPNVVKFKITANNAAMTAAADSVKLTEAVIRERIGMFIQKHAFKQVLGGGIAQNEHYQITIKENPNNAFTVSVTQTPQRGNQDLNIPQAMHNAWGDLSATFFLGDNVTLTQGKYSPKSYFEFSIQVNAAMTVFVPGIGNREFKLLSVTQGDGAKYKSVQFLFEDGWTLDVYEQNGEIQAELAHERMLSNPWKFSFQDPFAWMAGGYPSWQSVLERLGSPINSVTSPVRRIKREVLADRTFKIISQTSFVEAFSTENESKQWALFLEEAEGWYFVVLKLYSKQFEIYSSTSTIYLGRNQKLAEQRLKVIQESLGRKPKTKEAWSNFSILEDEMITAVLVSDIRYSIEKLLQRSYKTKPYVTTVKRDGAKIIVAIAETTQQGANFLDSDRKSIKESLQELFPQAVNFKDEAHAIIFEIPDSAMIVDPETLSITNILRAYRQATYLFRGWALFVEAKADGSIRAVLTTTSDASRYEISFEDENFWEKLDNESNPRWREVIDRINTETPPNIPSTINIMTVRDVQFGEVTELGISLSNGDYTYPAVINVLIRGKEYYLVPTVPGPQDVFRTITSEKMRIQMPYILRVGDEDIGNVSLTLSTRPGNNQWVLLEAANRPARIDIARMVNAAMTAAYKIPGSPGAFSEMYIQQAITSLKEQTSSTAARGTAETFHVFSQPQSFILDPLRALLAWGKKSHGVDIDAGNPNKVRLTKPFRLILDEIQGNMGTHLQKVNSAMTSGVNAADQQAVNRVIQKTLLAWLSPGVTKTDKVLRAIINAQLDDQKNNRLNVLPKETAFAAIYLYLKEVQGNPAYYGPLITEARAQRAIQTPVAKYIERTGTKAAITFMELASLVAKSKEGVVNIKRIKARDKEGLALRLKGNEGEPFIGLILTDSGRVYYIDPSIPQTPTNPQAGRANFDQELEGIYMDGDDTVFGSRIDGRDEAVPGREPTFEAAKSTLGTYLFPTNANAAMLGASLEDYAHRVKAQFIPGTNNRFKVRVDSTFDPKTGKTVHKIAESSNASAPGQKDRIIFIPAGEYTVKGNQVGVDALSVVANRTDGKVNNIQAAVDAANYAMVVEFTVESNADNRNQTIQEIVSAGFGTHDFSDFQSFTITIQGDLGNGPSGTAEITDRTFTATQNRGKLERRMHDLKGTVSFNGTLKEDSAMPPGGIDLNSKNLQLDVNGEKIDIKFDPAMIEQFKRGDFSGVRPVILKITPIFNIMPLLGLREEDQKFA